MRPIPVTRSLPGSVSTMSDGPFDDDRPADDVPDDAATSGHAEATGHPAVDEVLRSLDGLDGRPVDEHVAAFEDAHDLLRRALSGAGDDATD